jgi:pimeloyl-ACP methyl ester carboxylesterase
MGHSYAGAAIALVANTFTEIFERVILLDPILISEDMLKASLEYARENPDDPNPMATPKGHPLAMGAALRKDVWASREAAERSFRSKPFFRAWSKDVLHLHLRFGLAPLKDAEPQVTLAMPKWLEASSFAASWTSSYARASILSGNFKKHHADSSKGKTHIIIMSEGNRSINLEAFGEELGDSPDKLLRGTVEVMEGGHLSAQEQPSNLASWVLAHLLDRNPPATKPDEVKARL